MSNSKRNAPDQGSYDPETGEIMPPENDDVTVEQLFGGEGPQPDGSIIIPKITMATIRANPERCKLANPPRPFKCAMMTGMAGGEFLMPPIEEGVAPEDKLEALPLDHVKRMTFTALQAIIEPWGCVRYDDNGEPDAVFKSDFLFLPIGHRAVLTRLRAIGQVPLALEFWAQPAGNKVGYSWYYYNLAKYDRGMSPVDRLLKLGVQAGRQLEIGRGSVGLLADLRAN